MRRFLLPLLLMFIVVSCWAQTPATAATAVVPPLVKFSGTLANAQGTVGVIFALYTDQTGGAPLWLETQNVMPDANGRYTVYLGANHANGVPLDIFAATEARWLGVQPEGQAELPRVELVSVPYALKAADATTLGGQPLSAFVLASNNGATTVSGSSTATASGGAGILALSSPQDTALAVTTDGSASPSYMAKFTTTSNVESSSFLSETGVGVGIGLVSPTVPLAMLHVASAPPAMFVDSYSGAPGTKLGALPLVNRGARGTATSPSAVQAGDYLGGLGARGFGASQFSGGWRAAILLKADQNWTDTAQGTNIGFGVTAPNTAAQTIAMTLTSGGALGIGTQTPAPGTLLEVNGAAKFDGLVTFASGQTFSGAGSTITATSPLSGNGSSGSPLSIPQAGPTQSGYLSGSDWSMFNNKLSSLNTSTPLGGNGSAGSPLALTGTVPVANGGTGFSFVGVNGSFLRSNGTSLYYSPIGSSDLPNLNNLYVDLVSQQLIGGSKIFSSPASFNVGTSFSNALQAEADAVGAFAVQGQTNATDSQAAGVVGNAMNNGTSYARGVLGTANGSNGYGVYGSGYIGVYGTALGNGVGISGYSSSASGNAGVFTNSAPGGAILRANFLNTGNGTSQSGFMVKTNNSGFPSAILPPWGTPTSGGGVSSSYLIFQTGVLDSNSAIHNPKMGWRADPINNGLSTYNGKLVFYSGMDSANTSAPGLWINADGTVNFASNQVFPSSGGISGVTAGTGLTSSQTSGNITLNVDYTQVQPLLTGLTAGASCGASQVVQTINSNGTVTCVNPSGGGGAAYLPLSGAQVTGDVSIVPPTTGASSIYGLSVTQNQQGAAMPPNNPTPAWLATVPAAIVGTATDASGNVAAGVVGQGTGVGDIGVVAINNSGVDGPPALFAWNIATSGPADAISAQTSSSTGKVIHAEATASAGPGPCTGNNCNGLIVIKAEADATSGILTLFEGDASSPNASGINLNFGSALATNCAQGTQCPSVFSANVSGVGYFSIDGGLNLNTTGSINASGGQFNNGINVGGLTSLQNLQVNGATSFNSLSLSGLTVNGGTGQFNNGINVNNQANLQNLSVSGTAQLTGLTANGNVQISGMGNGLQFPDGTTLTSAAGSGGNGSGALPVYSASGTTQTAAHIVTGSATLISTGGNPANSVTVMLSGAAVFSSATSYVCTVGTSGSGNTYGVSNIGGSSFSIGSSDTVPSPVAYICVGN